MPSSAVVAGAYRPGRACRIGVGASPFVRGGLTDHVRSASTLLTAYMLTARLPYAMLADELMQSVLRTRPSARTRRAVCARPATPRGCFAGWRRCIATTEYRRTAVLAVDTDYVREATRTLEALAPSVRELGVEAAPFGLALAEWLDLQ